MSKRLLSLLLSLLLLVGVVNVPVGADAEQHPNLIIELRSNGGKFANPDNSEIFDFYWYLPISFNNNVNKYLCKDLPDGIGITRENHKLVGWFDTDNSTGGTEYTNGKEIVEDTTLYARWELLTADIPLYYYITNHNDAKRYDTVTLDYGTAFDTITKPNANTVPGYSFPSSNWEFKNGSSVGSVQLTDTNKDEALYIKAVPNTYTVTLDPNGGTLSDPGRGPITVTYDGKYTDLPAKNSASAPTRANYTFEGWYTAATGGTEVTSATDVKITANQTLYAHWTADKYNGVAFEYNSPDKDNSGTVSGTVNLEYDQTVNVTLPVPAPKPTYGENGTTAEYIFAGWYTTAEDELTQEGEPDPEKTGEKVEKGKRCPVIKKVNGAYKLYARWGYEITFNENKGETTGTAHKANAISGMTYEKAAKDKIFTTSRSWPSNPTRTGYKFLGWYTKANPANNDKPVTNTMIADPKYKTLYAKWEADKITITLDPGEGTLPAGQETIKRDYGDTYEKEGEALPIPTRAGYSFEGWYLDDEIIDSTTTVKTATPHKLYAKWAAKDVTLILVSSYPDGTADDDFRPSDAERTLTYGAKYGEVLAKSPANTDVYTFDGWYTTADDKDTKGVRRNFDSKIAASEVTEGADGDLTATVYARWKYGIEFYANYPGASSEPCRKEYYISGYLFGDVISDEIQPGLPEKPDGYENGAFTGWYTTAADTEGTGQLVDEESVADGKNLRLYARWEDRYCTIHLDPNKGKIPTNREDSALIKYGDIYGTFVETVPIRDRYVFDGWYTESGQKIEYATMVDDDCTLYAHWTPTKVTVKVDGVEYQVDYDTLFSDFEKDHNTKTGFNFGGWFTDQDCKYSFNKPIQITGTFSIYAKWIPSVTVTLDPQGGDMPSDAITSVQVNSDGSGAYPAAFPSPTKPGYTFWGWYDTPDYKNGGRQAEAGQLPLTKTDGSPVTTLYAGWDPRRVTVHFDYNGVAQTDPAGDVTYDYNAVPARLPSADAIGREFIGWFTDPVEGTQFNPGDHVIPSDPSADALTLTLYAHWGFKITFAPGKMPYQIAPENQAFTVPSPDSSIIPPDGMRFDHWRVNFDDSLALMPGDTYVFSRQAELTAVWSTIPLTISFSSTSGGYITTSDGYLDDITVSPGENVTFVLRPDSGYELKELIVDGESIPAPMDKYTLKKIKEDHSLFAVFQRIPLPTYASCARDRSCPLSRFSDLNPKAWYHNAVHYCLDNGIMNGYTSKIYKPNSYITRAELTQTLWNASGRVSPLGSNTDFVYQYRDVSPKNWFYLPVVWATNEGIVNGFGNGIFGPNKNITREQLVTILWRQAGSPPASINTLLSFYDCEAVSNYAFKAMAWATENHIINGRTSHTIAPKGYATRAEVATILKNYLE